MFSHMKWNIRFYFQEIEPCSERRFSHHESKEKNTITHCLCSLVCCRIQYSENRSSLLFPLYFRNKHFTLHGRFCCISILYFGRLVKKHTARIQNYEEERHFFMKFFDIKSFIIMAVMMSGGIYLRASSLAPERFIAVFYTGLGSSLLLAGILFGKNFLKYKTK